MLAKPDDEAPATKFAKEQLMAIDREYTIPAVPAAHGSAAIRIVTLSNGSVILEQGDQTIALHAYQAAEIAGVLWPADADGKPKFEEGREGGQRKTLQ